MIDINNFKESPEKLRRCIIDFNKQYKTNPDKAMSANYIDLWKNQSDAELTIIDWRAFYTNMKIREFYSEELELVLNARAQSLARIMGENKSSATIQGLTAILSRDDKRQTIQPDQNKIFVYSVIPLNSIERNLDNVTILENIPSSIANAISVIERDKT